MYIVNKEYFPVTSTICVFSVYKKSTYLVLILIMVCFQKMDTVGAKVLETAEDIQERRQQVLDRYRRFKELSITRRTKLEDSYRFQFFRRDADELEKWIQEKLQIASDENYKDPSNLQVRQAPFHVFVCTFLLMYVFIPCLFMLTG